MWLLVFFVVLGLFSPRVSISVYEVVPNGKFEVSQIYCVPLTCSILMCDQCFPGSPMKYCECCETCRQMESHGQIVGELLPVDHIILELPKILPVQNGIPVNPRPNLIIKTMFVILIQLLRQNMHMDLTTTNFEDMYQLKQVLWDMLDQVQKSPLYSIYPKIGVMWQFLRNLMQSYFANSDVEEKQDMQGITEDSQVKKDNPIDKINKLGVITKIACEENSLQIQCPESKINIISAYYGKRSVDICVGKHTFSTTCNSPVTFSTVHKRCSGKSFCQITATNDIFSDECVQTRKYLEVQYTCTGSANNQSEENSLTICEDEHANIGCPEGYSIEILEANYGRTNDDTCPCEDCHRNLNCYSTSSPLTEKCDGKNHCEVLATSSVFGDPCEGIRKYLSVKYRCKELNPLSKVQKSIACQDEVMSMQCKDNEYIYILNATYGRTSSTMCSRESIANVGICGAYGSQSVVSARCFGKNYCTVVANNKAFGNPCSGVPKYLEVEYVCTDKPNNIQVLRIPENHNDTISCPSKMVVHYANYGRTSQKYFTTYGNCDEFNCHSPKSFEQVTASCNNTSSCSLFASNEVFGDPCPTIFKYLEVGYSCLDPQTDVRFGESMCTTN